MQNREPEIIFYLFNTSTL